jgi:hypothetical protein
VIFTTVVSDRSHGIEGCRVESDAKPYPPPACKLRTPISGTPSLGPFRIWTREGVPLNHKVLFLIWL